MQSKTSICSHTHIEGNGSLIAFSYMSTKRGTP